MNSHLTPTVETPKNPLPPGDGTKTSNPRPLKVAVIREEFVALTGDPFQALVLNQFIYWVQRTYDFDQFLLEEHKRNPECNVPLRHGWIYKRAKELIDEIMLSVSEATMRRLIKSLVERGWIEERTNPDNHWDKVLQYRPDLRQIEKDLFALGYALPGFPLLGSRASNIQNKTPRIQIESSKIQTERFLYKDTEITPENTNKDHTQRTCAHDSQENLKDSFFEEILRIWKTHVGQKAYLTNERKHRLQSLLTLHFQNDLSQWESFCKQIKASPFLMGEGPSKWHVSFDWIISEKNILKVLEGNFDSPEEIQRKKEEKAKLLREEKTKEILESIEDPTWREWCRQLSEFSPQGYRQITTPLYWWQLEQIAQARFLKLDGRLVIIGSFDQKALNAIEERRYEIASVVARTYPTSRSIRTQLLDKTHDSLPHPENQTSNRLLNKSLNSQHHTEERRSCSTK